VIFCLNDTGKLYACSDFCCILINIHIHRQTHKREGLSNELNVNSVKNTQNLSVAAACSGGLYNGEAQISSARAVICTKQKLIIALAREKSVNGDD
jgi:hypothetical protein